MNTYRAYFKMVGYMTIDAEDIDEVNEVVNNTPYIIAAQDVDELELEYVTEERY